MKNLLLTGVLTLGLGLTSVNANTAEEALDRHLVAMDYNIEGPEIGEFKEEKYQKIKAKGNSVVSTNAAAEVLDRHLVTMDYNIEGARIH